MADTEVSDLTQIGTPTGSDELYVASGGSPFKADLDQLRQTRTSLSGVGLETGSFLLQYDQIILDGSGRLTLAGTSRVFLSGFGADPPRILGSPKRGSFTVPLGYAGDIFQRLSIEAPDRISLEGDSDLWLTDDFRTRSRIVLAGRG